MKEPQAPFQLACQKVLDGKPLSPDEEDAMILAGNAAGWLFAVGLLGVGFLAIPVMTTGIAYAICQAAGWKHGLHCQWNGPATLTARTLKTPVGETTGAWHYHPGFVYNVVRQGTITIEDGCGSVQTYIAGQAFETSEGRVHRAYNLWSVDEIESNMFVGPPGRALLC
jgi:hypothetical protein